ncbi:hexosyltransferase [Plakobranchus ocellatus]|uniref:Hexosyltransferase n=1 Tax=Plakobranchus ocellatus TaxID=259542 RepID=A0AAV4BFJ1_9GAST|nr:hexosyltransferase [Plakobranchus ocellatus]
MARLVGQLATKSEVRGSNPTPAQVNFSLLLCVHPALKWGYEFFLEVEARDNSDESRVADVYTPSDGVSQLHAQGSHHNIVFTQVTDRAGRVLSREAIGSTIPAASFIFAVSDLPSLKGHIARSAELDASWESNMTLTARLLRAEMERHEDIMMLEILDVYRNLPLKVALCHQWFHGNLVADYVMKTDDDCYINLAEVLRQQPETPGHSMTWWGNFRRYWVVERYGKWREDSYTSSIYPEFACGSGSVISQLASAWLASNVNVLQPLQVGNISVQREVGTTPALASNVYILQISNTSELALMCTTYR